MTDGHRKVAVLRVVKIGLPAEMLVRWVTWAERSEDRVLLGYFPHLKLASWVTWKEWAKVTSQPATERK
jgi:hypothetical protein